MTGADLETRRAHSVYAARDGDRRVLYVGRSVDVERRIREHMNPASRSYELWGHLCDTSAGATGTFKDLGECRDVNCPALHDVKAPCTSEQAWIARLSPEFNRQHRRRRVPLATKIRRWWHRAVGEKQPSPDSVLAAWEKAAEDCRIVTVSVERELQYPKIRRRSDTIVGPGVFRFDLEPAEGSTFDAIADKVEALARALRAEFVEVKRENPYKGQLIVCVRDPFPGDMRWRPPVPGATSVIVGYTSTGAPIEYAIPGWNAAAQHWLIAGATGGGKSVMARNIIAGVAATPGVILVLIDPKKVELAPWAPRADIYADSAKGAIEAFAWLEAELLRRQAWMKARGYVDMVDAYEDLRSGALVDDPDDPIPPPCVVDIDEMYRLRRDAEWAPCVGPYDQLLAEARFAAIGLVNCTQQPDTKLLESGARMNMTVRWLGNTDGQRATRIVFEDMADRAPTWLLPKRKGHGYTHTEGGLDVSLARSVFLDPDLIPEVVERTLPLRAGLPSETARGRVRLPVRELTSGSEDQDLGTDVEDRASVPPVGGDCSGLPTVDPTVRVTSPGVIPHPGRRPQPRAALREHPLSVRDGTAPHRAVMYDEQHGGPVPLDQSTARSCHHPDCDRLLRWDVPSRDPNAVKVVLAVDLGGWKGWRELGEPVEPLAALCDEHARSWYAKKGS